uniref:CASP-like protein n=1 Tax=Oryza barthii TaxID=65489 RepID=A0A0D3G6B5_9ORYZ
MDVSPPRSLWCGGGGGELLAAVNTFDRTVGGYVVAIGVFAFIYTTLQLVRHGVRLTGGQDLQGKVAVLVDFAGDQVTAYLLMSAVSAAIPITNRMREGADNVFTDSSAASISMAFFAFLCLALSALVSGFKLAKQTYI